METDAPPQSSHLSQNISAAVACLKHQLQNDYEAAYPGLREIIHLVIDEEEVKAQALSFFPHLFLPDLVEEHIAKLGLHPVMNRHDHGAHALAA
jgi:hypothetical protein